MGARGRSGIDKVMQDPDLVFRARAVRDRGRILRLAARLGKPIAWSVVAKPVAQLEEVAHGLAGSAGMFGFAAMGDAAARLERLAERWRLAPPDAFTARRVAILARTIAPLIAELSLVDTSAASRSRSRR